MSKSRFNCSVSLAGTILFLAVTVAFTGLAPHAFTQAAGEEQFLELKSVKPLAKRDGKNRYWEILIVGETKVLPVGTVVEFQVRQGQHILERFPCTIEQSRKFKLQHAALNLNGFAEKLFVRTEIDLNQQSQEVQDAMKKRPDLFWPDTSPWRESHLEKMFDLGKDTDRQRQREEVRQYFQENVEELVALDRKMSEARNQAVDKARFNKDGQFDEKGWRRWLKKDVRDPIRKIQKSIRERQNTLKFLLFKRDMMYLSEISRIIAYRTVDNSVQVYEKFELEAHKDDQSPSKLDVTRKSGKYLGSRVSQLCESQEIENPATR